MKSLLSTLGSLLLSSKGRHRGVSFLLCTVTLLSCSLPGMQALFPSQQGNRGDGYSFLLAREVSQGRHNSSSSRTARLKRIRSSAPSPGHAPRRTTPLHVMSWIPYWDQEAGVEALQHHGDLFSAVSLFWYRIDSEGNLATYEATKEDPAVPALIRKRGAKVFALVANMPDFSEGGDWDPVRVDRVISTKSARAAHIQDLLTLLGRHNFDGIDIDYEALQGSQREHFTLFIQELATALHERGKTLGVALHPKTAEGRPEEDNGSHAQDWLALSRAADRLYLMVFGEHDSSGEPGPVASLPWVERVLRYALSDIGVPRSKLIPELPAFGEAWARGADGAWQGAEEEETTLALLDGIRKRHRAPLQWNEKSQSPWFTYAGGNVAWLENRRSLEAKFSLARRYKLPTIGYWRLGGETEEMWDVLRKGR